MTLRVKTTFTGGPGAPYINQMTFGGNSSTAAQDAADAVRTFWNSFQGSICDVWTAVVEPEVISFNEVTGDVVEVFSTTTSGITMAASNTGMPQANQALIRLRTGDFSDGREIRGRIYIPGLNTVANNQGDVHATFRATALASANALIADTDSTLLVWRRPRPGPDEDHPDALPARDGMTSIVTAASVWSEWAILRSRRT